MQIFSKVWSIRFLDSTSRISEGNPALNNKKKKWS